MRSMSFNSARLSCLGIRTDLAWHSVCFQQFRTWSSDPSCSILLDPRSEFWNHCCQASYSIQFYIMFCSWNEHILLQRVSFLWILDIGKIITHYCYYLWDLSGITWAWAKGWTDEGIAHCPQLQITSFISIFIVYISCGIQLGPESHLFTSYCNVINVRWKCDHQYFDLMANSTKQGRGCLVESTSLFTLTTLCPTDLILSTLRPCCVWHLLMTV